MEGVKSSILQSRYWRIPQAFKFQPRYGGLHSLQHETGFLQLRKLGRLQEEFVRGRKIDRNEGHMSIFGDRNLHLITYIFHYSIKSD